MAGKVTLCMKIVGNNDEYNGYKQYFLHNRVSDLKVKLMDVLSLFVGAKLQRFLRMKNRNTPLFFKKHWTDSSFPDKTGMAETGMSQRNRARPRQERHGRAQRE